MPSHAMPEVVAMLVASETSTRGPSTAQIRRLLGAVVCYASLVCSSDAAAVRGWQGNSVCSCMDSEPCFACLGNLDAVVIIDEKGATQCEGC